MDVLFSNTNGLKFLHYKSLIMVGKKRERERNRPTNRKREKQTNREREKQSGKERKRKTVRQT